ncbi:sensor histidine kinase [Nocardia sp. IFM 10818]
MAPELADHAESVVREAVSNAIRHSGVDTPTVRVDVSDDLTITVSDDGRGIPDAITPSGLDNLAHRAELAGGTFAALRGADGSGTQLRWSAPLD